MTKYQTEDGMTVETGDRVYNYYDMVPGTIEEDCGDGEWFYFRADGARARSILNGPRICSMGFAQRRDFPGAS